MRTTGAHMPVTKKTGKQDQIGGWEDDGGARPVPAPARSIPRASDRRAPAPNDVDTAHDSDTRGEHRYPDAYQTPAEQKARLDRDKLKRRLAR